MAETKTPPDNARLGALIQEFRALLEKARAGNCAPAELGAMMNPEDGPDYFFARVPGFEGGGRDIAVRWTAALARLPELLDAAEECLRLRGGLNEVYAWAREARNSLYDLMAEALDIAGGPHEHKDRP